MKLFSKNLIVLRTVWNYNQVELAQMFGVVGPSYSRWEDGTEPRYDVLVKIAKQYKISIDRLLTEELTPETCPPRWKSKEYPPLPEKAAEVVNDLDVEADLLALVQEALDGQRAIRADLEAVKAKLAERGDT